MYLNEDRERVLYLFQDDLLLLIDAVLQDALDHTAPVRVHRKLLHLPSPTKTQRNSMTPCF